MFKLLIYFLLSFNQSINAGDYNILITDDLKSCQKQSSSRIWPSYTPKAIAKDVLSYFSSNKYDTKNFPAAIANGHFEFCGTYDLNPLYDAFAQLCKSKVKKNRNKLATFMKMVNKDKLLYRIEDEMQKGTANQSELNNMEKCRLLISK